MDAYWYAVVTLGEDVDSLWPHPLAAISRRVQLLEDYEDHEVEVVKAFIKGEIKYG